jgi:hypothetical protein
VNFAEAIGYVQFPARGGGMGKIHGDPVGQASPGMRSRCPSSNNMCTTYGLSPSNVSKTRHDGEALRAIGTRPVRRPIRDAQPPDVCVLARLTVYCQNWWF